MKGFIEFETCNHEKVFANVSHIISVVDGEAIRLICFNGGEHVYIKTNESYEEICNKIIDALSEEHKESEDPWAIMNLLFKAMHENVDATDAIRQNKAPEWRNPETGWIPVSERLPDPNVAVRVKGEDFEEEAFWGRLTNRFLDPSSGVDVHNVTHWMPLPEPPEGV